MKKIFLRHSMSGSPYWSAVNPAGVAQSFFTLTAAKRWAFPDRYIKKDARTKAISLARQGLPGILKNYITRCQWSSERVNDILTLAHQQAETIKQANRLARAREVVEQEVA